MSGYIGRTPLSEAIQSRAKYTATANQTTFSFSYQPGFLDVYLNGIKLEDTTDYTATTGTEIVLTTGATAGHVLEAVGLSTFSLLTGKHNYSATAAPAVTDDSSDGYRVGSMWIDTTNDEAYRCVDDTVGAAVWIGTTLETTDLGSLAMVTPTGTGSTSTFLRGDNSWTTVNTDLVADTTPQLGGNLDLNSNDITGTGNIELTGSIEASSNISATNMYVTSGGDTTTNNISGGFQHGGINSKSLVIEADPNNVGANTRMQFNVDGSERMRIDSSGNVGIGTSSPTAPLHINKGTNAASAFPSGNWAAKVFNQTDGSIEHGLVVANRWAGNASTAFEVGGLYDNGDGFDTFVKVDGLGRVTMPYQPSVVAYPSSSSTTITSGSDQAHMAFGSTKHNAGNHYNTSTSVFTCPVAGYYFVSANVRWEMGQFAQTSYIRLFISKNNGDYNTTKIHAIMGNNEAISNYMTIVVSGVVYCSANDTLRVKGGEHNATDSVYHSESSFCVRLLG